MKLFNLISTLLIAFTFFGCSSTPEQANAAMQYHTHHFERTHFKIVDQDTVKREFASDHHIMMSLLNRPMTADQRMMLAFAQQSKMNTSAFVQTISIRGDKSEDNNNYFQYSPYSQLIANDINAIEVQGSL